MQRYSHNPDNQPQVSRFANPMSSGSGGMSRNMDIPPPQDVKFLYEVEQALPLRVRWERFLAGVLPLTALLVGMLVWRPEWSLWFNIVYCFLIGLWAPVSYLIDPLEDSNQYRDMFLVLALSFAALENPLLAMVGFTIVLLITQGFIQSALDWNMLGMLFGFNCVQLLISGVLAWIGYLDSAFWQDIRLGFTLPAALFALFVGWFFGGAIRPETRT